MKSIVVLHSEVPEGAPKDEKDVLVQASAISDALRSAGCTVEILSFSMDLKAVIERLQSYKSILVFNIVESVMGKGSLIHLAPSLLDAFNISYTGSETEALFLTSSKLCAKKILNAYGLPTPEAFVLEELKTRHDVRGRYIIKSVWEHASVGLSQESVVNICSASALYREIEKRSLPGGDIFAEAFIEGREFNLSILAHSEGPQVLPPAEILFNAYPKDKLRIVDYKAKWEETSFEFQNTPRSFLFSKKDEHLFDLLKDMARQCWYIFGLRGYARVDFRVDSDNRPWILEINANPCLSPDSGFVASTREAGLDFNEVILRIVNDIKNIDKKRHFHVPYKKNL